MLIVDFGWKPVMFLVRSNLTELLQTAWNKCRYVPFQRASHWNVGRTQYPWTSIQSEWYERLMFDIIANQFPQWTKLLDLSELPSPIPFVSLSISWLPTIIRLDSTVSPTSQIMQSSCRVPSLLWFVRSFWSLSWHTPLYGIWIIFLSQPVSWNYHVIIRLPTPPHCVQVTPGLDLPAFLPFPPRIPELALSHVLSY